jgi:hypothetical protein
MARVQRANLKGYTAENICAGTRSRRLVGMASMLQELMDMTEEWNENK